MKTIDMEIMDTYVKISILELGYGVQTIEKKILGNIYEPKVALEDKVYPKNTTISNQGML